MGVSLTHFPLPVRSLATLAVLLGTAVTAPPVLWHLAGYSEALPARAAPTAPAPDTSEIAPADLGPILALGPFGNVSAPPPEPTGPVGETTLDLVLHGVVVRDDPARSIAFIGTNGTNEGYRPGEDVAGAATLIEVASSHVVLDVGGELQTLSFPGTEGPADAPPEQDLAGLGRLQALVASQTAGAETADAPEDDQDSGPETPQDYIDMWRERIRQNPAEVLDSIGLIPTDEGYRIADDHDSGVGRAGLLAGDLVTRVNGQTVGDVDSDRRLYDEVAASGLAQIEIERDGRLISMSFPLR